MNEGTMHGDAMADSRVDAFKQEVAGLKVQAGSDGREKFFLGLGAVLLIAGPVIAFAGYLSSTSLGNPLDQNELIILALAGVCLSLAGVALFLRYSLGRLLRFWLLRQIYESHEHVDRLAERFGQ